MSNPAQPRIVFGTRGSDNLTASQEGGDRIFASDGDDRIQVFRESGYTDIHGGLGSDYFEVLGSHNVLYGEEGDDKLTVDAEYNRIHGNGGNDSFWITGADNLVTGGAGEDTLSFAGDRSTLITGDGNDEVTFEKFDELNPSDYNRIELGNGNDSLDLWGHHNTVLAGEGSDSLFARESGDNRLEGGAGDDSFGALNIYRSVFVGGAGDDSFKNALDEHGQDGSSGNRYFGNEGDDSFASSGEDNMFLGGAGRDTLRVEAYTSLYASVLKGDGGDDELSIEFPSGGTGNVLDGGEGRDALTSVSFYNTLKGGAGSDTLSVTGYTWTGYSLENTLTGGKGEDLYEIGPGVGTNTIREDGVWNEQDRVRFLAVDADEVSASRTGDDLEISNGTGTERLIVEHFFDSKAARIEQFEFADGAVWTDKEVESLIQAMAAAPGTGGTHEAASVSERGDELSLLLAASHGQTLL
ncbi:calcium-binding protein [Paenibacillus sp. S-38]|uniref:calcium-binding protein n=1 Tax=Paenibacillus sp. S-38 TaxID=3416710 RepID=UPI003CF116AB